MTSIWFFLSSLNYDARSTTHQIPKKVLNGNFYTTRPVGRPRNRWADVVQWDALQLLGIRGWRRWAKNRDEWRCLMREAKARKGLMRHIWNGMVIETRFKNLCLMVLFCIVYWLPQKRHFKRFPKTRYMGSWPDTASLHWKNTTKDTWFPSHNTKFSNRSTDWTR